MVVSLPLQISYMRSKLMSSEPVYEENYFGGNGDSADGDGGVLASDSLLHHFDNMGLINAYVPYPWIMYMTCFVRPAVGFQISGTPWLLHSDDSPRR